MLSVDLRNRIQIAPFHFPPVQATPLQVFSLLVIQWTSGPFYLLTDHILEIGESLVAVTRRNELDVEHFSLYPILKDNP